MMINTCSLNASNTSDIPQRGSMVTILCEKLHRCRQNLFTHRQALNPHKRYPLFSSNRAKRPLSFMTLLGNFVRMSSNHATFKGCKQSVHILSYLLSQLLLFAFCSRR